MSYGKKRVRERWEPTEVEVQASGEGLAEIASGRAICQQGLTTTYKDQPD